MYVDRPFAERPYGRIRLNEPTLYDLHELVVDAIAKLNADIHSATETKQDKKVVSALERKRNRIRNVKTSLSMLAEEKGWNEL